MTGPARIAHEIEKLERRPSLDRGQLEELAEALPYIGDSELDRLIEVLQSEEPGSEAALLKLLGPARAQQRRNAFVIFAAAARRELSSRHPAPPSRKRTEDGWVVRSRAVAVLFAFDSEPEAPDAEGGDNTAEPPAEPVAAAEAAEPAAPAVPARPQRKKRSELTGREWRSQRSRAHGAEGLPDTPF